MAGGSLAVSRWSRPIWAAARYAILPAMEDAVNGYRAASEARDADGVMATLARDVAIVSPLSGRMVFRGHSDARILLSAVYDSLSTCVGQRRSE